MYPSSPPVLENYKQISHYMDQKSLQINQWLLGRGLSQEVIDASGIYWNGKSVVIPIFDKDKNFLFNKYRRDPFSTDENLPKYTYETGSTAALYNVHTLQGLHGENVFIVEGELDALLLNSFGLNAVSSTGGSQTFRPEWFLDFLNNKIFITYDRDEAGIKGALRVNTMLASAKIIFLPDTTKGKDVTDYFKTHTIIQFLELMEDASSWVLPLDPQILPDKKSGVDLIIKEIRTEMESILKRQRTLTQEDKSTKHTEMMLEIMRKRLENWRKIKTQWGNKKDGKHLDDIACAKAVPITQFVKFDNKGFAPCLFHSEKTPSMQYRPERNKIFCYSCRAHKDVIDIVMEVDKISFNEAITKILCK